MSVSSIYRGSSYVHVRGRGLGDNKDNDNGIPIAILDVDSTDCCRNWRSGRHVGIPPSMKIIAKTKRNTKTAPPTKNNPFEMQRRLHN